jgi:hypothetical protein
VGQVHALVRQGDLGEGPASTQLTDEVLPRHAHAVEKRFVEVTFAGRLAKWTYGHTVCVERQDEERDA